MRALVACVVLAGCAAGQGAPDMSPARVGAEFVPDATGLGIAGSSQRVDFGRSPKGVVPLMARELGQGTTLSLAGCPAGIVQHVAFDDLTLSFTRERFVGWKTADARAGQTCG